MTVVFSDIDGASAWNQFEQDNVSVVGSGAASAQGVDVNITDTTPWDLAGLGEESSAVELHGDATVAGFTTDVYIEVGMIRRGRCGTPGGRRHDHVTFLGGASAWGVRGSVEK